MLAPHENSCEKWLKNKKRHWLQQCFLPKNLPIFCRHWTFLWSKVLGMFRPHKHTHGGKRGYGGVWLRVVDSFSFLVGKKRRAFIPRRPLRGTQVLFICWLWQYSPHCVLFVHWMPEVLCSEVSAFSPLSNWMICLVKKKEPVYISCMPVPKYTCFYFI